MSAIEKKDAISPSRQLQLTDLPDEILIRILSLLPTTKDAVRTCLLLNKGQQHLWKSLTSLDFQEDHMFFRGRRFVNFVDRVMDLRDHSVPLVSFSLGFEMGSDNVDSFKTWITKAVQSNVQELTLSIGDYYYMNDDMMDAMEDTPYSCIFGCQSLVKLVLESITFDAFDSSEICLPRLKYLRLGEEFRSDDDISIEKLLSSPMLEELIIDQSDWYTQYIHVSSPKLQVLKICEKYEDPDDQFLDFSYAERAKICIVGHNLKHFCYIGNLTNEFRICASSSTQLSNVEIYVSEEIKEDRSLNCYEILKGLTKTRNLALTDYFLEGLQNISEHLDTVPVFECLTRLDIQVYKRRICIDSLMLMRIYERCPHLECLNIGKLSLTVRSLQLSPIPLCFQTSLKKILVHYYVSGDDEADAAIDVLLNTALVLEELVVYCKRDERKGFQAFQELQDRLDGRPRASKDCIISVRGGYYIKRSGSSWLEYDYEDYYLKSMNES